jgi:hypothetical protein
MNRAQKLKMLYKALAGNDASLRQLKARQVVHYESLTKADYEKITDTELNEILEYYRQEEFQKTGIMPPPVADFDKMTDEKLTEIIKP